MTIDPSAKRMTRLTSDARRLAILDNAELLFVKDGFQSTSTREIAEACDVTEPVLYRHFNGKEDLYLSVLTRMLDEGLEDLTGPDRAEDMIQAARLRILEALLLCGRTDGIQEIVDLVHRHHSGLASAFRRDGVDDSGSELAQELGKLILERLGIA